MEAKDTVMSGKQIDALVNNLTGEEGMTVEQAISRAQAEISFKAGIVQGKMDYLLGQSALILEAKKAGKQEAVEEAERVRIKISNSHPKRELGLGADNRCEATCE